MDDPVGLLRPRLQQADKVLGATAPRTDDVVCDLAEALLALDKALKPDADPAVRAVAGVLIGAGDLAVHADDTARPVVRRILDGYMGQEAAQAVTRLVLDLAHARGVAKALERQISGDENGDPERCRAQRRADLVPTVAKLTRSPEWLTAHSQTEQTIIVTLADDTVAYVLDQSAGAPGEVFLAVDHGDGLRMVALRDAGVAS